MSIISETERDGASRGSGNFQQKIIRDYSSCKEAEPRRCEVGAFMRL